MLKKGLSGSALKWIAVFTMLIDHFTAVFYFKSYSAGRQIFSNDLYMILRGVGRLAFPIFAFLLVEGYFHTRDVKKYLLRLFLFGLVSEVPFDLAFRRAFVDWGYQNVYFTLFLGLLAVWLWDTLTQHDRERCGPVRLLLATLAAAACAVLALLCKTDYGFWGVLTVVSFALFREREWLRALAGGACLLAVNKLEAAGFPDFLLFHFYNGQRGRQPKYFFYLFYPTHLLVLVLLSRAVYGG